MSRIDFSRLRSLTAGQIASALERDGFQLARRPGGHRQYNHRDGRRVTVPYHRSGRTFPIGTLRRIIVSQARWTWNDLRRLGLV